jgi:hypothetical protein
MSKSSKSHRKPKTNAYVLFEGNELMVIATGISC